MRSSLAASARRGAMNSPAAAAPMLLTKVRRFIRQLYARERQIQDVSGPASHDEHVRFAPRSAAVVRKRPRLAHDVCRDGVPCHADVDGLSMGVGLRAGELHPPIAQLAREMDANAVVVDEGAIPPARQK